MAIKTFCLERLLTEMHLLSNRASNQQEIVIVTHWFDLIPAESKQAPLLYFASLGCGGQLSSSHSTPLGPWQIQDSRLGTVFLKEWMAETGLIIKNL